MKRILLVGLAISVTGLAYADWGRTAARVGDLEPSGPPGGPEGTCRIQYCNACSGWLYIWGGWAAGDRIGTVYDLPADCGTYEAPGSTLMDPRS